MGQPTRQEPGAQVPSRVVAENAWGDTSARPAPAAPPAGVHRTPLNQSSAPASIPIQVRTAAFPNSFCIARQDLDQSHPVEELNSVPESLAEVITSRARPQQARAMQAASMHAEEETS